MGNGLLIAIFLYLGLMFLLAQLVESRKKTRQGAFRYALSLMVYCTAWTYYGSIGFASDNGLSFLAIYLGPVISIPLWTLWGGKVIRIAKTQSISSLADMIAARYGKDRKLEAVVAIFSLIGVLPYISLQIKALSESYSILAKEESHPPIFQDPALYFTALLLFFTLLFGTRFLQANKARRGLVSVIAFESVFKLAALLIGSFIVFNHFFLGINEFSQFIQESMAKRPSISTGIDGDWFWMLLVSAVAFMLLPRQFQTAVVENTNEKHLWKAAWVIPLYLLLINLPVLPLALVGEELLPDGISTEYTLLHLSQASGPWGAGMVYLGGFSAATSMIIVSSIALGNMLSTNLVLPSLLKSEGGSSLMSRILLIRRVALSLVFILAFVFYRILKVDQSLVSIGMISFIGIFQFVPAFFGGLFWRKGNGKGAMGGILSGFFIWTSLLLLPTLGFYSLELFFERVQTSTGLSATGFSIAISAIVNTLVYLWVSINTETNQKEQLQAELFVMNKGLDNDSVTQAVWQGGTSFKDIRTLLIRFLGGKRTTEVLDRYARINGIDWSANPSTDSKMASYAERLLTEAIGPSSAHIVVKQVVPESRISPEEVLDILEESKALNQLNKELQQKREALENASKELQEANTRLKEFGRMKDDFLYTVTHELRSPLAAIRSQAELVRDIQDMPAEDRTQFLFRIVQDCERLTRLINDVLDLERFEAGNLKLSLSKQGLPRTLNQAMIIIEPLMREKDILLSKDIAPSLPETYYDQDRILQVFINLLSNAIKHSPSKSELELTIYQIGQELKVIVADLGSGIRPEEREQVFDKFYQVSNQTRKKPMGSGLGLAICKNIVDMHQGRIWLEDNKPKGTRAIFTLPLYKMHKAEETHQNKTHG
jgi:signal transduction histidine kinase